MVRVAVALLPLGLTLALGCASTGPGDAEEWAELPPAEELYAEGLAELDGGRRIWFLDTTNYPVAIEKFQDIIDNYPYSDYAVLAELRIADAYFEQELYEEALSYYQDFADLHPDHDRVPYTIYRAGLSHVRQVKGPERDQTATRQALAQIERLLRDHPYSTEAQEAEGLWREMRTRLGE